MADGYRYPAGLTDADFADGLTSTGYQPHNFAYGTKIPVDADGTVTLLGVRTVPVSGTPTLKLELFNSSGNLVGTGGTLTNSGALGWKDTGAVSISVTAGDYYVFVSASDTQSQYGYDSAGNGCGETIAYASFPPSSLSVTEDETGTRFGVRLYLEEGAATQNLTQSSTFTNTNTFYAPTVTRGAVTLTPSLFTNTNSFFAPTVSSVYNLTPSLYTNDNTFYGPTATYTYTLLPTLYSNDATFFGPTITTGAVELLPSLFTETNVFFGPTVSQSSATQELLPSLFTETNTFNSPTVTPGAVTLSPSLLDDSTDTFFTHTLSGGVITLIPEFFQNDNTFYTHTIIGGASTVTPSGGRSKKTDDAFIAAAVAAWIAKNKTEIKPLIEEEVTLLEQEEEQIADVPETPKEVITSVRQRRNAVNEIQSELNKVEEYLNLSKSRKVTSLTKKIYKVQQKIDNLVKEMDLRVKERQEQKEIMEIISIIEEIENAIN